MKRRLSKRQSSSFADQDRGSVKRRKKSYSTRVISWEEQQQLGPEFASVGKGNWPVRRIIAEKGPAGNKQYQVEWEPHPNSEEEFEPQWVSKTGVGKGLVRDWERLKAQEEEQTEAELPGGQPSARRARSRRIIPDSSGPTVADVDPQSDVPLSPPGLSDSSISGLEISETQYPTTADPLTVRLPPLPSDKSDYDTVRTSQISPSNSHFSLNFDSPLAIASNLSQPLLSGKQPSITSPLSTQSASQVLSRQLRSPRSRITDSSPRALSSQLKPPSNLGKYVEQAPEGGIGAPEQSPSLRFLTQLPFPNEAVTSQTETSHVHSSPSANRRSSRLASPFNDLSSAPKTLNSQQAPESIRSKLSKTSTSHVASQGLQENTPGKAQGRRTSQGTASPASEPYFSTQSQTDMAAFETDASMAELGNYQHRSPLVNSMTAEDVSPPNGQLFETDNYEAMIPGVGSITAPLTVHASIEEEAPFMTDEPLLDSKTSSQESLNNQREIETVDGVMIPVRPILGLNEFAIALPAEGKVKSAYDEIIKIRKKAILKFISRKGAPGTSEISNKKTLERNEMQEMLQRLNNTVTHTDLGLPMAQTQYALNAEHNAAYADYAGSKFVMLGYLVDQLLSTSHSIAIFAQGGPLIDLLAEYLSMKRVTTRRHDHTTSDHITDDSQGFSVDLLSTQQTTPPALPQKPSFVIAFDISFTTTDPQMQSLRLQYGEELPIIHFLVTNSSEHVDRCVPVAFTSNIRLKVVVRTTYLASPYLGGEPTYIADESDEPEDRAMDMSDFQRAVRKSPARRLALIADVITNLVQTGDLASNWTLGGMPELKLSEFDSPPKVSRAASRTPQPRRGRTQTPISRATTPVGRKRLLEVDGENGTKRQRLTPVRDTVPESQYTQSQSEELQEAHRKIAELASELATAREQAQAAEQKRAAAEAKASDWQDSHASLLHRHEKSSLERKKLHKENTKLNATITAMKERDEKIRNEKDQLKHQISDLKAELVQARTDLKAEGGDVAQLEEARQEARTATAKMLALEKSLTSTKGDFEFTRTQYQEASKQATDMILEVKDLEAQVEKLKLAAEDSKRSLKAMNYQRSLSKAMETAEQFKLEVKNRDAVIKRLQEENATLKSRRGVQTRGSSVQPASSPAPRSRQASPAPGHAAHLMPPSGSRASVLRHER
ncbi:hypothetical protein PMZ80_006317 [Knufia obscura]|uniref:Chromo domain-containing protein n=1 Tax=Knufia obscura TaxID=1635080 RepID=A0ABR0RKB8_9EURO|nr:hypothetical protein PMZ80_006317 [Knufia obscura]